MNYPSGSRVCGWDWYHSKQHWQRYYGGTGEHTVPLSNNKKSMTLVNTENNSAVEDYFPPLKRFQTCSSQCITNGISRRICLYFKTVPQCYSRSWTSEAELQDNILKYNPIASNVPPKYSGSYGKNLAENWRLYTV